MKRYTVTVVVTLFAVLVLAGLLGVSTSHATGLISANSSFGSAHPSMKHGNIASRPFSGIVEGTVLAISTTSITIHEETYHAKNATSTEFTFALATDVRINADQEEYATSSISDVAIGSSVSLVIERVGKDAGKVREIRLQPNL